jgi:hypothetical protein
MVSLFTSKRTKSVDLRVDIQAVLKLLKDYKEYYQETARCQISFEEQSDAIKKRKELDDRLESLDMSLPVKNWLEKELQAASRLNEFCRSGSMNSTTITDSWYYMSEHGPVSSGSSASRIW